MNKKLTLSKETKRLIFYILKRVGLMLLTFLAITITLFILVRLLIPSEIIYGPDREIEEARLKELGYNQPIIVQLGIFFKNIFTKWDFGTSWKISYLSSVGEVLGRALPATITINLYAVIISIPLGIFLGIFCAQKKGKWPDILISVLMVIIISLPSFAIGFIIQYFLGYKAGLPMTTSSLYDAGGTYFSWKMLYSQILPVLALTIPTVASLTRFVRAEMIESFDSEYVTFARSLGIPRRKIIYRYAFKNALVPIFPMILGIALGIFSGSFIIEQIFAVPGVGKLMVTSIEKLDYDVFIACSMFYTFIGLFTSLIMDIALTLIDPRIVIGGNKHEYHG